MTKSDIWERKLLDFTLRNTMLNLTPRRKAIQFTSIDVNQIEDSLQEGGEYCLLPKLDEGETPASMTLYTSQTEAETQSVLKSIYRAARTSIEETGANSLYLAIGLMRWYEDTSSEQPRYAPLLLLPVMMVYKRGHYFIRRRDEEIQLNITLIEFLRQNFGIEVKGLETLPQDEHGVDVPQIQNTFRQSIGMMKRWEVLDSCVLGIFSFNKFLMWNDIHTNHEQLSQNPIVRSLIDGGLTFQPSELHTDLKDFDREHHPADMALPVSVDSSQMTAVYEAGHGNSFILYGPPGTGKSQTITNLIANALFQGKRVLFVAEKMAALEVVQKRLEKIGLGPFCLELHSNKVAKRHVLSQLNTALNEVRHIQKPEDYGQVAQRLYDQRQQLLAYMDDVHKVGDDGWSLYDCIARYESIEGDALELSSLESLKQLTAERMSDYEYKLSAPLETVLGLVGQPSQHPLRELLIDKQTLGNQEQLQTTLQQALQQLRSFASDRTVANANAMISTLRRAAGLVAHGMESVFDDEKASVLESYASTMAQTESLKAQLLSLSREELLDQDALSLQMEWHEIRERWFLPRWWGTRKFVSRMRFFAKDLTRDSVPQLLDLLLDYKKHIKECHAMEPIVQLALQRVVDIEQLQDKLSRWHQHLSKLRDWFQWCNYRDELLSMGLSDVVSRLESSAWMTDDLRLRFLKGFYRAKCAEKMAAVEMLQTFEGVMFDEQVRLYRDLTQRFQTLCQKELYARLAANVPRVTDSIVNGSEIGLLNRNISNGGRGLSIRDLLDQIPNLLPRLCPCMLMSPMSVAQYISLQQEPFDVVIFDEASQMPTSEAVGAIARGKSLIVVGDPKQMPPTSFFMTSNVDEEEASIDDLESILEDCRTLGLPSLQLCWHYRSRHESLIAFSNNEYYDGSLITFPSSDDLQSHVSFVAVDGCYDRAGKRSNRAEAEAIADEIERRLRDPHLRKHSIGVVAFSVAQQNLVEDVLSERFDSDHQLQEWADAIYEPIFVKNLENVQGDERDVILFSIGYGPDKDGNISMNFGPLNNSGGERRLNVAVSRARREMMVFSTLHASQIDLNRSKAKGVEGLKHFLEYAEFCQMHQGLQKQEQPDDVAIASQIARVLEARGHQVQLSVGRSLFKVDLAIVNPDEPDQYCLGLLLDGEAYHDTQTTRDREIVQPGVLQSLGWSVMRIWSVDWLNNPGRVIDRIEQQLKDIERETPAMAAADHEAFDISSEKELEAPTQAYPYKRFTLRCSSSDYVGSIRKILEIEQPITKELLCRRLAEGLNMARVSPTLQQVVDANVRRYFYEQQIDQQSILWTDLQTAETFSGYRTDSDRDITEIPLVEIDNCLLEVVGQQLALAEDDATLITAKRLGFTRRGPKVEAALHKSVDYLVKHNRLRRSEGKLSL